MRISYKKSIHQTFPFSRDVHFKSLKKILTKTIAYSMKIIDILYDHLKRRKLEINVNYIGRIPFETL